MAYVEYYVGMYLRQDDMSQLQPWAQRRANHCFQSSVVMAWHILTPKVSLNVTRIRNLWLKLTVCDDEWQADR